MSERLIDEGCEILVNLIDLNQWEWFNITVLNSVIGRHVYFSIAAELLSNPEEAGVRSLKQVLKHPGHTDRAIRLKLREMERMGLITSDYSNDDKRVRYVVPTEKLIEIIKNHAKYYRSLLERNFILLEK